VQKFADWVRTSVAAGEIIKRGGAVTAFNKTATKAKAKRHKHEH
jgi:hypothetical protein